MRNVNQAFHTKTLSISQREAVIKHTEKKDRDKRYTQKTGDQKAFSNKLKTVLPKLLLHKKLLM